MTRITSIGAAIVLSVVISGNLVAQQTNSVVQTVTFGVARTPQMLVNSLTSLPSARTVLPTSRSKTLQQQLAIIPAKITFSSRVSDTPGSHQKEPMNSERTASSATLSSTFWMPGNDGSVQTDLRTFLLENEFSHLGKSPLVLTITE